eukprot:1154560-Pelagomonas_calceolata.AAC.2
MALSVHHQGINEVLHSCKTCGHVVVHAWSFCSCTVQVVKNFDRAIWGRLLQLKMVYEFRIDMLWFGGQAKRGQMSISPSRCSRAFNSTSTVALQFLQPL